MSGVTVFGGEGAPLGTQLRPQRLAGGAELGIQERHPPVPVLAVALDQSNMWDELKQVRLSARGGLAQFCTQAHVSRGCSN